MEDYLEENDYWTEPTLDLIQRTDFVQDTPYRDLFAKQFPRVSETGLDYECVRMWKLGRSIIENGYKQGDPILIRRTPKGIVVKSGWHRTRVLAALEIDFSDNILEI